MEENLGLSQKPSLSMIWVLDPTTGKPVARWVAEPMEPMQPLSLLSAA
jgi:hypothetical protein